MPHDRHFAPACHTYENPREGKVDCLERDSEVSGDLDHAKRARSMEIADKCPVHRILRSRISMVTRQMH